MRVGSNGPPIHKFNTDIVFQYWVDNRHRLAQKQWVKAMDSSVVVSRIRKKEEGNYISTNVMGVFNNP